MATSALAMRVRLGKATLRGILREDSPHVLDLGGDARGCPRDGPGGDLSKICLNGSGTKERYDAGLYINKPQKGVKTLLSMPGEGIEPKVPMPTFITEEGTKGHT